MTYEFNFDSLDELIETITQLPQLTQMRTSSSAPDEANGWRGTASLTEAIELARDGWPEGLRRVHALADTFRFLEGKPPQKWDSERRVSGTVVDMGAFTAGEPESMVTFVPPERKKITISVNIAAWTKATPGAWYLRGGLTAALADALHRYGHDVEINAYAYSRHYCAPQERCPRCYPVGYEGETINSLVRISAKKPHEPLNLMNLAFILSHRAMFRRFIFRVRETMIPLGIPGYEDFPNVHLIDASPHDYGKSIALPENLQGDIYIPPLTNEVRWTDMMSVTKWFLRMVREQDIEFLRDYFNLQDERAGVT